MKTSLALCFFTALSVTALAGPRTSATYGVTTDTVDGGGTRTTSGPYSQDGSLGGITGISTVGIAVVKHGYVGQLYDTTGLQLSSSPAFIAEAQTRQLDASLVMDDTTKVALNPSSVAWSVVDGPINSISASGIATAGIVSENTGANVSGIYQGRTASLTLNVINVNPDNFGSYASDGLDDAWQIQYFGFNNPNAGPSGDPDGDGQTNLAEFKSGYAPTDSSEKLVTLGGGFSGSNFELQLSKVQPGTRYVFQSSTNLVDWIDILFVDPSTVAAPFTQALPASGNNTFYRVRLEEP